MITDAIRRSRADHPERHSTTQLQTEGGVLVHFGQRPQVTAAFMLLYIFGNSDSVH